MVATVFNTVRYLRPVQIYGRLYRRRPADIVPPSVHPRVETGNWRSSIERSSVQTGENRFQFLNEERTIGGWNDAGVPKLWLYNLHYFECPDVDLIHRWINGNPVGHGNGWDPYPLSLRIGNWIKWALNGNSPAKLVLDSLAIQAEYLSGVVEYHLLANHLFANAKALVLAGMFFEGREAERWLKTGLHIVDDQLREQILSDGGHFERSPMYHAIILEDLLDLINAATAFGVATDRIAAWSGVAQRMLGWLVEMTHPDGRISFFNDAAFGVASETAALVAYARSLGQEPAPVTLGDSGYIRLHNANAVVIIDTALVGPDYQPGHAHADTLSFELSVQGRRAIVNSGLSTYESGPQRLAERGTAAHNTVRIDGENSSEVWSSFRVARRARPFDVRTDNSSFAEAAHDGYRRLSDPVVHRRRLELKHDRLVISDHIDARHDHKVELFFHLHPESHVGITLDSRLERIDEQGFWHPEFNTAIPNTTVIGRWEGNCPAKFQSEIAFPKLP